MSESREGRLYEEACDLVEGLLLVHDGPDFALESDGRERLNRSVPLFEEVIRLNPRHWPAMWVLGKVHQRLDDYERALDCFEAAHRVNPDHADVAREASIAAMEVGRPEAAIEYCERALQSKPSDAGLRANWALALLFSGRVDEAARAVEAALEVDPSDEITKRISGVIEQVVAGTRECPRHVRELG